MKIFVLLALLVGAAPISRAALPPEFEDVLVASGVTAPSVLTFAPDGRLFVGEKPTGKIRIVKNGALLATPFLTLSTFVTSPAYFDSYYERGLLGIAFHPSFATNQLLYVYFTVCTVPGGSTCQTAKNRVVRFRANGDVVDPSSYTVILNDLDSDAGNHNAGWIGFGPLDGKLYVSTGDGGANGNKAQDLASLSGKILRINPDGTVPSDNPFAGQSGRRGEVWAFGFRNPWRCRFAPDGRLFCADVGLESYEEVDAVARSANYGWPTTEGPFPASTYPQLTNPIHAYAHTASSIAIIGGDFGLRTNFPGDYQQSFFFADYGQGWIKRIVLNGTGTTVQSVQDFASGIGALTDLVAGPDGALYYISYSGNAVRKIAAIAGNRRPVAVASATPTGGVPPLTVQFSGASSSDPDGDPITYGWDFGDGTASSTLANPGHVYQRAGTYSATLTVSDGRPQPGPGQAAVSIRVGGPPTATIQQPADGTPFDAGDTIQLVGSATDPEDGALPTSSLRWDIRLHHDTHFHPFIDDLTGSPQSFTTATTGEHSSVIWYEIILTATDSTGVQGTSSVDVVPNTANLSFITDPPGLQVTLDGQPRATPFTVTGVVGFNRTLGAPSPQSSGANQYAFSSWSDGGAATHTIATPAVDQAYVARFTPIPATGTGTCGSPILLPAGGGTVVGTTSGSSALAGSCGDSGGSPERVYRWTPSVSGPAILQTCGNGTNYDTILYVRRTQCASGTEVACNDDTPGCAIGDGTSHHGSRVSLNVTAGETYFVVVDGYAGRQGTFALTVMPPGGGDVDLSPDISDVRFEYGTTASAGDVAEGCAESTSSVDLLRFSLTSRNVGTADLLLGDPLCPSPCTAHPLEVCGNPEFLCSPAAGHNHAHYSNFARYELLDSSGQAVVIGHKQGYCLLDALCSNPQYTCGNQGISAGCADIYGSTLGCQYLDVTDVPSGNYVLRVTLDPLDRIPEGNEANNIQSVAVTVPARTTTGCATPIVLPAEGGTFSGTTTGASVLTGGCGTSGSSPERVFQWTPAVSGTASIQTCGGSTAYDTVVYLRQAPCGSGAELACNDDTTGCATASGPAHGSHITPTVQAGTTYFIVVDGYAGRSGAFSLSVTPPSSASTTTTTTQAPPTTTTTLPAGTCASPVTIPAAGGTFTGTTSGGSALAGTCASSDTSPERIFRWTPTVSGTATIQTCGGTTAYDTVVYLRQGACASGTELACNDDTTGCATASGPAHGSHITPTVQAGTTYFIVVDGYGGRSGAFSLSVTPPSSASTTTTTTSTTLPAGTCASPVTIPAAGGTFTGTTSGGSALAGTCASSDMSPERIFRWTPATSGTATIETCGAGSTYDTIVYLREGACASGTELACNDDTTGCATGSGPAHGSRLAPTVQAGTTYFIVVDGYAGRSGAFSLNVTPPSGAPVLHIEFTP